MTHLTGIQGELERLFDIFNDKYYAGMLRKPVIIVQSNRRRTKTMGWCTYSKVWTNYRDGEFYFEIAISAEYLDRPVMEICSTLLHEMVHLHCTENGINDTSRDGRYHNKRFKEIAESHGLIISYDHTIGWSPSKLNDEAQVFVDAVVKKEVFVLARERRNEGNTKPKRGTSIRYICPLCGSIVRATSKVNIVCGDCSVSFVRE